MFKAIATVCILTIGTGGALAATKDARHDKVGASSNLMNADAKMKRKAMHHMGMHRTAKKDMAANPGMNNNWFGGNNDWFGNNDMNKTGRHPVRKSAANGEMNNNWFGTPNKGGNNDWFGNNDMNNKRGMKHQASANGGMNNNFFGAQPERKPMGTAKHRMSKSKKMS